MISKEDFLAYCAGKFGKLGAAVQKRPWTAIAVSSLIAILFSMGAPKVNLETEGVFLWIPTTSETYVNFLSYNDDYQDGAKLNFLNFIIMAEDGGSIFRKSILSEVVDVHTDVTVNITEVEDTSKSFSDHCFKAETAKNGIDSGCQMGNALEIFSYNADNIPASAADILAAINAADSISPVTASFGGLVRDLSTGEITSADSMVLWYGLKNSPDGSLTDFEKAVVDETTPSKLTAKYPLLSMQRLSSLAFDEEVVKLVSNDMPLFIGAIYIVIIFLALTFGRLTCSENRVALAFVALPQVFLSLAFATGCQGMSGSLISTLNFTIGFILAGVSVDDMIVVEEFYKRAKAKGCENILEETMKEAGLAVFLTSFTAVVAFMVGAFVDLPAVRSFCICAGLSFCYNFILNVTFFPAFLFLDERRCGMSCCPSMSKDEELAKAKAKEEEGEGFVSDKVDDAEAPLTVPQTIFAKAITPFLASSVGQVTVVVGTFAAAIFVLLYGLDIETGLSVKEVVPDDSFVITFFDTLEEKFDAQTKRIAFIVKGVDYKDSSNLEELEALFTDIESIETVVSQVGLLNGHWLYHYQTFLENNGHDKYTDFGKDYTTFLGGNCGNVPCNTYALDVVGAIDSNGDLISVKSSRFMFDEVSVTDTGPVWKLYKNLEAKRKASGIDGYYFVELFLYAENDSLMFDYLFRSLGVTLVAVATIMFVFTDAASTFYITLCVACIDCHLLGIARMWDTRLNSVLFTCMIMSVGLCVDYCVHIAHAFVHAEEKKDPNKRLKEALTNLGPAVLKGGFTTLLGVVLLSMASSSVFRMFFKMLFLTVLFGVFHGIIALPVFLTLHQKMANAIGWGAEDNGLGEFTERQTGQRQEENLNNAL
mmetsp:Transcript_22539/g.46811  ORF Transcript_22539/g.46811 Transcript_22539/m.46811 type:complete len:877 (+) Transcript_22539:151-2781(+)|eukprot:CAMPEP_0118647776 /NCGR_PEP_ID=MMETSP0785-20121206/8793_1 /TAXON_ID=91992 /ORGANISM="Bolidomonas pacifica, Strain CCMP 1866" /LENGTH=876 /DNA_ID=CAMNT_0006539905 /DNA_START=94 /DNA_END=2724 /DNA_ORIENTATION=-